MTRTTTQAEDCCTWCRRPIRLCTESACDDAGVYRGVLVGGEWKELKQAEPARQGAALAA